MKLSSWIPAVILLMIAGIAIAGLWVNDRWREFERRASNVEQFAAIETARADSAVADAVRARAYADSLHSIRDTMIVTRWRMIRDTMFVPEPCTTIVASRDSVIVTLLDQLADADEAYDSLDAGFMRLRSAYDLLSIVNDSLSNVLSDRPRPPSRWLPRLGVGPIAGICTDGACVGVGVSLSWELPWPF